jgi:hypothetical protein
MKRETTMKRATIMDAEVLICSTLIAREEKYNYECESTTNARKTYN